MPEDPLGHITENVYDLMGNLIEKKDKNSNSTKYTYDRNGNRLTVTDAEGNVTTYTYDSYGNKLSETDPSGKVTSYTYDDMENRISMTVTLKKGSVSQTLKTVYEYDKVNRLIRTTFPDGGKKCIEYDSVGKKSADIDAEGIRTEYEYDVFGNLIKTHYQGSTRILTDESSNITDTYNFDAFGVLIGKTGNTYNDYMYTGEQYDENIGFYYLRARYMNPVNGRFLTMDNYEGDIFEPMSLHKYTYAHSDPVNNTDPSGNNILVLPMLPLLGAMEIIATIFMAILIIAALIALIYLLCLAVEGVMEFARSNSKEDPYARPGQKKQGREKKEKKKGDDSNWKSNPNKRKQPPKHHTPGKDHQKYPQNR